MLKCIKIYNFIKVEKRSGFPQALKNHFWACLYDLKVIFKRCSIDFLKIILFSDVKQAIGSNIKGLQTKLKT